MATRAALYTDEDMQGLVATLLRSRGLDVTTVPEQAALGKTDSKQLELAIVLKRCLITHNRVDFERLNIQYLAENKRHFGIMVGSAEKSLRSSSANWYSNQLFDSKRNRKSASLRLMLMVRAFILVV